MAKATTFIKEIRTVRRCTCQWKLLRRLPHCHHQCEKAAEKAGCGSRDELRTRIPPGEGLLVRCPPCVLSAPSLAFNFPPERGIPRKPGAEPVPLVIRLGDMAILMIRAVFFSTERMGILAIMGECLAGKSSDCMQRREKIPPHSGHGNSES